MSGEIIAPKRGLSTVANLEVGDWLLIADTENGGNPDVLTHIVGTGPAGPNTVTVVGAPNADYSVISPAALAAGNTNDYAPTGLAGSSHIRITPDAGGSVLSSLDPTGLSGSLHQKKILCVGAGTLTIPDASAADAGSTVSMRFSLPATLPGFPNVPMTDGDSADFWYDVVSSLWRLV